MHESGGDHVRPGSRAHEVDAGLVGPEAALVAPRADLLEDGGLGTPHMVAGGLEESVFQPTWSPSGVLHYVSDQTGWWNKYYQYN